MFVDILGYEGIYKISPQGEIFSLYQNRLLNGWIQSSGYKAVSLYKNGKATKFHLHTLLAQAFIPNPLNLPEVNHKDGNKQNNALSNLEWVTGSQNIRHAFASGLTSKTACIDYSKVPTRVGRPTVDILKERESKQKKEEKEDILKAAELFLQIQA